MRGLGGAVAGAVVAVWLLGFLVGPLSIYLGLSTWWLRHLLLRSPFGRAKDAAPGRYQVEGAAVARGALVAPLTGIPCALFKVRVERAGKNAGHLRDHVARAEVGVRDESGEILVRPAQLETAETPKVSWLVDLERGRMKDGGFERALDDAERARIDALLGELGIDRRGRFGLTEWAVTEGDYLHACGVVRGGVLEAARVFDRPRDVTLDETSGMGSFAFWLGALWLGASTLGGIAALGYLLS